MVEQHTVIEELDASSDAYKYDDQLQRIYADKKKNDYDFLTAVFAFLDRRSGFFHQPEASKHLARLLRDVKRDSNNPAAQATKATEPAPAPRKVSSTRRVQGLLFLILSCGLLALQRQADSFSMLLPP